MYTLSEFNAMKNEVAELKAENKKLVDKSLECIALKKQNSRLKSANKKLCGKCSRAVVSLSAFKEKHKRVILVVAELYEERLLSLTIDEIADRLFTRAETIYSAVMAIKRERK